MFPTSFPLFFMTLQPNGKGVPLQILPIYSIVDQLSRFPILVLCRSSEAEVVVKAHHERLYADYGIPDDIVLDQAESLKGHVMDAHRAENDIIH